MSKFWKNGIGYFFCRRLESNPLTPSTLQHRSLRVKPRGVIMNASPLADIDNMVTHGKAVIAADDDNVIAIVKEAIESDKSASFYLNRAQADAIRDWYWTPDRVRTRGLREVSSEEIERIESELGIDNLESFRITPALCECGHQYGAFEFLQQGIREHGLETVKAIFASENLKLIHVNASLAHVCPACNRKVLKNQRDGGIEYEGPTYGGCSCCADI
jgi:hypothetical protein